MSDSDVKPIFLMYSGGDVLREKRKDSLIYIFPSIGWKQNLYDYVLIDIFYGYRFSIFDEDLPAFASEMTGKGGEAGIKVKLNLQKILKRLLESRVNSRIKTHNYFFHSTVRFCRF